MPIYNPEGLGNGGGGGGGTVIPESRVLPTGYEFALNAGNELVLLQNGDAISTQSKDGAWFKATVEASNGQLNLGGMDGTGASHSLRSAGQNVGFKNEFMSANERNRYFFFPAWQGVTVGGDAVIQPSVIEFSDVENFLPNGLPHSSINLPYDQVIVSNLFNSATFELTVTAGEPYTGKLRYSVMSTITNVEIYSTTVSVSCTSGSTVKIESEHPFFSRIGDQIKGRLFKENGQIFRVRAGAVNTTLPYELIKLRRFVTRPIVSLDSNGKIPSSQMGAPSGADIVTSLTTLNGADRLPASAVRDYPVMTATDLGMAKLGPTMSISGDGALNTAVSPTGIKIVTNEAARLALPMTGGATLVIQQDNSFTYGIEANLDPTVPSNWKQIGTVATNVVSFNDRTGAVVPAKGDYDMEQIGLTDRATSTKYVFRVENGVPYIEEIA